jgi:hypothetical protein
MAPRELLTLKLPDQQPEASAAVAEEFADEEPTAPKLGDLKPFERGPEITEIH